MTPDGSDMEPLVDAAVRLAQLWLILEFPGRDKNRTKVRAPRPVKTPRPEVPKNREIADLVARSPLTLREIGEQYGLTSERVRQIAMVKGIARRPLVGPAKIDRDQSIAHLVSETDLDLDEIGGRYGLSALTIRAIAREWGVRRPPRPGGPSRSPEIDERNAEIARLILDTTMTYQLIGQRYGVSRFHISYIASQRGVGRRGEAKRRRRTNESDGEGTIVSRLNP
jgi:hypothetical protein